MSEPRIPTKPSSRLFSSALSPGPQATAPNPVRPRNRRPVGPGGDDGGSGPRQPGRDSSLPSSACSGPTSRTESPRPSGRSGASPGRSAGAGTLGQFLGDSWAQGWTSVQGFASALLSAGDDGRYTVGKLQQSRSRSRGSAGPNASARAREYSSGGTAKSPNSWGPAPPPPNPGLGLDQVAAGSLAEREAALRAARTASVLESHDGVNGGLDVVGKHKRRTSDETAPGSNLPSEDCLVYVHQVQLDDTYAGLILRYRCREDVFRRANGLWSRDNIQTRKWLVIPVDTCEIRGRPCEGPSWHRSQRVVDPLAPTSTAADEPSPGRQAASNYLFSRPATNAATEDEQAQDEDDDRPWTHVRWVQIDSFSRPVQIGRVARQALGYFPPRRKKSIRTASSLSTPRPSSDFSSAPQGPVEWPLSPRDSRPSRGRQPSGTPVASHSRGGSDTADGRPAWMRRPGGVGTMGGNVRVPGPDNDYLNLWTRRHMPGLNIEGLPSMSVMGSETARFGFALEAPGIVESPFQDGRDTALTSRQGSGLDRAAAAVESWLRGALAKRPGTPLLMGSRPLAQQIDSDLIELADTGSEDDRLLMHDTATTLLNMDRNDGDGSVRGRTMTRAGGMTRRQKAE